MVALKIPAILFGILYTMGFVFLTEDLIKKWKQRSLWGNFWQILINVGALVMGICVMCFGITI